MVEKQDPTIYEWHNKIIFRQLSKYGHENGYEWSYMTRGSLPLDVFLYELTYQEVLLIKQHFEELRFKPSFIVYKDGKETDKTEEMIPYIANWLIKDFGELHAHVPPAVSKTCKETAYKILTDLGVKIKL